MKWTLGLLFAASVATALPQRGAKAFSLFSVVTFPNEECLTQTAMSGICITAEECTGPGTMVSGNCASGFGVCCFRYVEGTAATPNVPVQNDLTHIQNEDFPMTVGNVAAPPATTLTFPITGDASICQIRLDFVVAVFTQPTAANSGGNEGVCRTANTATGDALTVRTADGSFPGFDQLCGTLSGQHIYLDTSMMAAGATVSIQTGTNQFPRTWKILVRRLRCDDPDLSPGCLQFHIGVAGPITSLNGGIAGQVMLRNLDYEVCIRPLPNMCGLIITQQPEQAGAAFRPFALQTTTNDGVGTVSASGNFDADPTADPPPVQICQVEGIIVPNSENGVPPIFCGAFLNGFDNMGAAGQVIAHDSFGGANTFAIGVGSDTSASAADTGFSLRYQQFC